MDERARTSLLSQPWVQSLALVVASVGAFGTAIEGGLVWDDEQVIGAAVAARGPLDVFSSNLFRTLPGEGAKYYRPLTSLSYWLDAEIFQAAPNVGMHAVNLLWHASAAILVLAYLRRLVGASTAGAGAACFSAALLWTVLPIKAENVAWITGRGDIMGTVFVLGGLELASRRDRPLARATLSAAGLFLAVLCKEAMVAGAALIAAELFHSTRATGGPDLLRHAQRVLKRPEALAALATAASYLILRQLYLPIATGGERTFAQSSRLDALQLFLETTGVAASAFITPWRAQILRSPIGFSTEGRMVHDVPVMLAIGAAIWVAAVVVAWRWPSARPPLVAGLGAFLPVSNVVGMNLESRVSDRFLYLPSVGLALALALAVAAIRPVRVAAVAVGAIVVASLALAVRARSRSELFVSSDRLFSWEVRSGNQALAVYSNAAFAAAAQGRYREARDLQLALGAQYVKMGLPAAVFDTVVSAIRNQVKATEDTFPPAISSYERLLRTMIDGQGAEVDLYFEDGIGIRVDTGTPQALRHYRKYGYEVRLSLARLLARRGDPEGMALAEAGAESCPRCSAVLADAAEVALAAVRPDEAERWASGIANTPRRTSELVAAALQRRALEARTPYGRAMAAFVGGAFKPACDDAFRSDPTRDVPADTIAVLATACALAPASGRVTALLGGDERAARRIGEEAERLRNDTDARSALVTQALDAASPR